MDMYGSELTKYNIPLKHLDYEYIRTCTSADEVEKIIKVLRSGKEGKFPDLENFAENRLRELNPESKVLRKPERLATKSDLEKGEWEKIDGELKEWMDDVKRSESVTSDENTSSALPPVRGSAAVPTNKENKKASNKKSSNEKRITPRDYREWDKFDIDEELRRVEEVKVTNEGEKEKSALSETPDCNDLDTQLMQVKANREKDKGNEAFRAGDLDEAVLYYTRSINILHTAAAFNNRAQTYIKLKNWNKALDDCNAVLKIEPTNLKALLRRGAANQGLTRYTQARDDLKIVLNKEPNNRVAKDLLSSVEKSLEEQKTKGRRMMIEEVSGSEDEEEDDTGHLTHTQSDRKSAGITVINSTNNDNECGSEVKQTCDSSDQSLSFEHVTENVKRCDEISESREACHVKKCEDVITVNGTCDESVYRDVIEIVREAHKLYQSGQYGEACDKFDNIFKLLTDRKVPDQYLAVSYSNRAFCHMKLGNCRACVNDCNKSLSIEPSCKDVLLLRASAYELMEKYIESYVDYTMVLNSRLMASGEGVDVVAQRGSDRCSSMLRGLHGAGWRDKLPSTAPITQLVSYLPNTPNPLHQSVNVSHTSVKLSDSVANKPCASDNTKTPTTQNTTTSLINDVSTPSVLNNKSATSEKQEQQKTAESDESKEAEYEKNKDEGNKLFSKGEFDKAVEMFTRCAELYPDRVVPYTNRALCYLRLKQYNEVLEDCNRALGLDFQNVKALFRRAQAYRMTDQLDQSVIDLETLLVIDKGNTAAKKELSAVLKDKEDAQEKRAHLALLREQHKKQLRAAAAAKAAKSTTSSKSPNNNTSPATSTSSNDKKKRNTGGVQKNMSPYEFLQSWSGLRQSSDIKPFVDLLLSVKPQDLKSVISNKLEGEFLVRLVRCVDDLIESGKPELALEYLNVIPTLDRFDIVYMFLSDSEKKEMRELFNKLEGLLTDKEALLAARHKISA